MILEGLLVLLLLIGKAFQLSQMIDISFFLDYSLGIGCFVCTSTDGSDSQCEDPFPNYPSLENYQEPCLANMKGRLDKLSVAINIVHCVKC